MKILIINKFLFPKGGDAVCALATGELLEKNNHQVVFWGMKHSKNSKFPFEEYFVDYIDLNNTRGIVNKLKAAANIFYSFEAKRKIEHLLKSFKPDIVHLHNFAHQISPSILHVFKKYNIPMVMTMHDYKLVCARSSMHVDLKICEACNGGKYFNTILRKCIKNSYSKSSISAAEMYLHHVILKIYDLIDIAITPSQFLGKKVKEMGLKNKVEYLPNFVLLDKFTPCYISEERSITYFGRIERDKGIFTLIKAMREIPNISLKIIGEGSYLEEMTSYAETNSIRNVRFFGYKTGSDLQNEIKKSICVVIPSEWYENNPLSVIEGFALGKPAIGSRIGGIPELIVDGVTGYLFKPGDENDLRDKILLMVSDKDNTSKMGLKGREMVETTLNPNVHYQHLLAIYKKTIETKVSL